MQFYPSHREALSYADPGQLWYMPAGQTSSHLLPAPAMATSAAPHMLQVPFPYATQGPQYQHAPQAGTHPRTRFLSSDSSCPDMEAEAAGPETFLPFVPPVALADLPLAPGQEDLAIPPSAVQAALESLTQSGQLLCSKSATGKPLKGAAKVKAQAKTGAALCASAEVGTLCIGSLLTAQGLASLGMGMGMCPTEALVRALADRVPKTGPRAVPGQLIAPASPSSGARRGGAGAGAGGGAGVFAPSHSSSLLPPPPQGQPQASGDMGHSHFTQSATRSGVYPAPSSTGSGPANGPTAVHTAPAPAPGTRHHVDGVAVHAKAGGEQTRQQTPASAPSAGKAAPPAPPPVPVLGVGKGERAQQAGSTAGMPAPVEARSRGEATLHSAEDRLHRSGGGEEGYTWGRLMLSPSLRKRRERAETEEDEEEQDEEVARDDSGSARKKSCVSPLAPLPACPGPDCLPYSLACVADAGPQYTQWTSYRLKTEVLAFTGGKGETYLLARAPALSADGYDQYQWLQVVSTGTLPPLALLHHLPMPPTPGVAYAVPEGKGRTVHITAQPYEGVSACLSLDWCDFVWSAAGVHVRLPAKKVEEGSQGQGHGTDERPLSRPHLELLFLRPLAHTPSQWKGTVASQTQESDDEEHRSLVACSSEDGSGSGGHGSPRSMQVLLPTGQQSTAGLVPSARVQGDEEADARSLLSGPASPLTFPLGSGPGLGLAMAMGTASSQGGRGLGPAGKAPHMERDIRDRTETVSE